MMPCLNVFGAVSKIAHNCKCRVEVQIANDTDCSLKNAINKPK